MVAGVTHLQESGKNSERSGRALQVSESRLQQAATIAKLGHYVWDAVDDYCLFCSDEHALIHGLTPSEYIAQSSTMDGLTHPDDREAVRAAFTALRDGENFELEYRIVTPSGEVRFVREIGRPIKDENGVVVQEIGTSQDITKGKQIELALRENEKRLVNTQRIARLGSWEIDCDGNRRNWSDESFRILGVDGDQLDNNPDNFIGLVHPEDLERVQRETACALRDRLDLDTAYRMDCPDGICRTIHEIAEVSLAGGDGFLFATVQDITERVRLEEKLYRAQKIEAVGKLTGGIAHDFNNLLGVIQGSAELLALQEGIDPEFTNAILAASTRGAELTHRLLAFSRRQSLDPQVIDAGVLVSELSRMIDRTFRETIEIDIETSASLWTCLVDQGQLENALLNVAINARDAMPEGGRISFECANRRFNADDRMQNIDGENVVGDYVAIAVSDHGKGMSATTLKHAIEPFYTTKEAGLGSGLGLSMVYGFIKQTSGHLRIDSEEGTGTTITLYLPSGRAEPQIGIVENRDECPPGRGETVLILEDDPNVRSLVAEMAKTLGYNILNAADADRAGVMLVDDVPFDILLTDVLLNRGLSGPEFAEEVLKMRPDLPIVFMSGYSPEVAKDRGVLGADRILLKKPFLLKELATALRRSLDDA